MIRFLSFFAASYSLFGAFAAGTAWEVRTTGSDANGGGFNQASTGTDRSQQDVPYTAYTDIVIGGTTTQGTSAAFPFDATSVGNVINITAGAGCTVQRAQIVSQAAGVATFDKSLGTAASVCTGNLGGGLATIATAFTLPVATNVIWIKAGTYTFTTTATTSVALTMRGYATTRGDSAAKPLITTATDSTFLFALDGSDYWVDNLHMTNTAAVRSQGIKHGSATSAAIHMSRCILDGFSIAMGDAGAGQVAFYFATITDSQFLNSTTRSLDIVTNLVLRNSYFSDSAGPHLDFPVTTTIDRCVFARAGTYGAGTAATGLIYLTVTNSVFYNNGTAGIQLTGTNHTAGNEFFINNVFWSNGTYGISLNTGLTAFQQEAFLQNNAFGDNTTLDISPVAVPKGLNFVTLTADPFTSSTDFSLNSAAGGGALLKTAGLGFIGTGTASNALAVGTVQPAAGAAAATIAYPTIQ